MSFKHIVRIARTDIQGNYKLIYGLAQIKGVSYATAQYIVSKLKLDSNSKIGELKDKEVEKIEEFIKKIDATIAPPWLLNRRKDLETGKDLHLVGPDLELKVKEDIDRQKKVKNWRGIRHALGLKVRGQRTKTTGRKGVAVGVKRREVRK